jgi:hypothetical protein
MSVYVDWDNTEHTIVRFDLTQRWTWDEFSQAYQYALTLLESVPHRVHFIIHMSDPVSASYMPPNSIQEAVKIYKDGPPNLGKTIFAGGNAIAKSIHQLGQNVYPTIFGKYLLAASLDEARTFLHEVIRRS